MASPDLEIGLLLHTRHLIRVDGSASPVQELWETAEMAESKGFDHLWVGDSPRLSLLDRGHADCLTLMAALAARTERIRIGAVPLIIGLRNPVLLAHACATLDVLSQGRIIIGASASHQYRFAEREFEACGVPFRERAGRLNEAIEVIRRLWSEDSFAFQGKYFRFDELGIQPKPVQRSIPFWIAASENEQALRRVARLGDGWFTVAHNAEQFASRRQRIDGYARECGRDSNNIPSVLFAAFHLTSSGKDAEDRGWSLAEQYFRQPRSNLRHLCAFFGTPERVAEKLRGYLDAGLRAIVARIVDSDARLQMAMLCEELRPRLSARS